MKTNEALGVLGCIKTSTIEDIKGAYRRACKMYHPDRNPAGLEMMKLINCAYEALKDYEPSEIEDDVEDGLNLAEHINDALNAVIGLGLNIEVCGTWIWVSGDTRTHKEVLKEAGFKWAPKKMMWYFAGTKTKGSRGKWDMDKIRESHGSVNIKNKYYDRLSA